MADGVLSSAAIKEKLAALEAQRATLEAELTTEVAPSPISLHPGIAEHYGRVVIDLAQALHRSDSEAAAEARELVRRLIETGVDAAAGTGPLCTDHEKQNRRPGEPGRR
ncbi:hypothetical protein [Brevundimonas sp. RM1]